MAGHTREQAPILRHFQLCNSLWNRWNSQAGVGAIPQPILVSTKKQIPKLEDKAAIQQATTVDNEAQSVSCPAPSALEPSFQSQSPRLHFSLLHTELRKLLGRVSEHVAVINLPGWSTRQLALLSVSNRDEHGSLLLASSRALALPNCSVIIATRGQTTRTQLVVAAGNCPQILQPCRQVYQMPRVRRG